MQRGTVPGHNKATGQDIVLDFDSGTVPDTAQVRTAVAGDTGWVARIVQGRIAVPAHKQKALPKLQEK